MAQEHDGRTIHWAGSWPGRALKLLGAVGLAWALSVAPAGAERSKDSGLIAIGAGAQSDQPFPSTLGVGVVEPTPGASPTWLAGPGSPVGAYHPSPSWSPDQTSIVYAARGGFGPTDLYVADVGGAAARQLTATPDQAESSPAWSPDGTTIAFVVGHEDVWLLGTGTGSEIWTMAADGSGAAPTGLAGDHPAWSPDGQDLAFTRDGDIYVHTVGTDETRRLTSNGRANITPAWSPDGRRIAYSGEVEGGAQRELFSIRATGGAATRLTRTGDDEVQPSWSPDGKSLAFERDELHIDHFHSAVWRMRRDGSGDRRIVEESVDPDWR